MPMSVDVPRQPEAKADPSAFRAERPTFPVTRPDYSGDGKGLHDYNAENRAAARKRARRNLALGIGFLAPNILGFLTFTAIPLVFSMVLAFSNWDLKLHNMFKDEPIRMVGLANFTRLLNWKTNPDFYKYLGNTLFLMMGMPFSIAASLGSAIMLSKDLRGGSRKVWMTLLAGAVLVASVILLSAAGAGGTGMLMLIGGLASAILIAGVLGGTTVYRTLFYVPHFTAGVATFLLWKKLYNPTSGPITRALTPPLNRLTEVVNDTSPALWGGIALAALAVLVLVLFLGLGRLRRMWLDGDVGAPAAVLGTAFLFLPAILGWGWLEDIKIGLFGPDVPVRVVVAGAALLALAWNAVRAAAADRTFALYSMHGVGGGIVLGAAVMVAQFVAMGFTAVFLHLPAWASDGLAPPNWLTDISWAKPSIMIMGFWGAIGSNTMLLYLAALTNVPQELYEAADIDGAGRFQKFWNVTWPQLAPTTFFIVVMGVIGGLQGGFEMARVMTQGGPAGQTKTLAYFIYTEGFETGRLGYSSAVAWTLFLMVLLVTLFNWKFGNKYVND